jgi:hypothetical protein
MYELYIYIYIYIYIFLWYDIRIKLSSLYIIFQDDFNDIKIDVFILWQIEFSSLIPSKFDTNEVACMTET